jgi:hypothetical protein
MTSASQNKLLARRLLEELVNTGAVDRLPTGVELPCVKMTKDLKE